MLPSTILIIKYSGLLNTSEMQFAFKKNHSTAMCTLVLKEVINYYLNNNSDVYTCFIDATKAFDRIRYDKLFKILINRGVPAMALRALLDLYQRQVLRTSWNGKFSRSFSPSNGIRQGGVISPLLFCVYMDELLKRLETEGVGCWIGKHFYGCLGYADDLTLAAPSVGGLRQMVKTCEMFGQEYSVDYNPTKTICVLFGRRRALDKPRVELCGTPLSWVDRVKHLGIHLEYNLRETTEIRMKKSDMIQRVNTTLVTLGVGNDKVISKIFNTQCAHFYGAQAWRFEDSAVEEFQVMWNRCVRRVLSLPHMKHRRYLPHLIGAPSAMDQIYCRFIKMQQKMESSTNERVRFIARICRGSARSISGGNLRVIARKLDIDITETQRDGSRRLRHGYKDCPYADQTALSLIHEMRDCLNGEKRLPGFNIDEVQCILSSICTE